MGVSSCGATLGWSGVYGTRNTQPSEPQSSALPASFLMLRVPIALLPKYCSAIFLVTIDFITCWAQEHVSIPTLSGSSRAASSEGDETLEDWSGCHPC